MIVWWIGDVVLLVVIAPVVALLLHGVLRAAKSIVPKTEAIAEVAAAASRDLDAVELLYTTQRHVDKTVATVERYGDSLDIILEDA
jgi:hypothetical protein